MRSGGGMYLLSLVVLSIKAAAFALSVWSDSTKEFRAVRVWLGILVAEDTALIPAYKLLGLNSFWYARIYYGADLVSILCGLFVILRLAEIAFSDSRCLLPFLRRGAILILIGLIMISAIGVASPWGVTASRGHFVDFAQQLEQNLNVAGMLAAVLLWGSMNALAIPGIRLRRVTAAMGISYSAGALSWAFYSLFRHYAVVAMAVPLAALIPIVMIGWTLAFERDMGPRGTETDTIAPIAQSPTHAEA